MNASCISAAEPSGKVMFQLFKALGVLTVSEAKMGRSLHETEMLLPEAEEQVLKTMLRVTAGNLALQMFPPSITTYIEGKL